MTSSWSRAPQRWHSVAPSRLRTPGARAHLRPRVGEPGWGWSGEARIGSVVESNGSHGLDPSCEAGGGQADRTARPVTRERGVAPFGPRCGVGPSRGRMMPIGSGARCGERRGLFGTMRNLAMGCDEWVNCTRDAGRRDRATGISRDPHAVAFHSGHVSVHGAMVSAPRGGRGRHADAARRRMGQVRQNNSGQVRCHSRNDH